MDSGPDMVARTLSEFFTRDEKREREKKDYRKKANKIGR
jgi:hypothetical protein